MRILLLMLLNIFLLLSLSSYYKKTDDIPSYTDKDIIYNFSKNNTLNNCLEKCNYLNNCEGILVNKEFCIGFDFSKKWTTTNSYTSTLVPQNKKKNKKSDNFLIIFGSISLSLFLSFMIFLKYKTSEKSDTHQIHMNVIE